MKLHKTLLAALAALALTACHTPQHIVYFQDVTPADSVVRITQPEPIRLRPSDQLSIVVSCQDYRLTDLFNLTVPYKRVGTSGSGSNNSNGQVALYTVDSEGNIDFPVLGTLHVEGMTREEITRYVHDEIVSRDLAKDPVVTVEYANLSVTVLGEVSHPGRYSIDKDRVTVLEVLSQAGDLSIQGKRDRVWVYREEAGQRRAYQLDLCSATQVAASPAYYLQQNDQIYVEPNATRQRQSTVNGNTVRSTSFWFSLASLLTTLAVLIF